MFRCPDCGYKTKLNFHPRLSHKKWNEYKCSRCGYKVVSDYEEIAEIKKQFKEENGIF